MGSRKIIAAKVAERAVAVLRLLERGGAPSEEETAAMGGARHEVQKQMPSEVATFRLLLLTGCRMSEMRDLRSEKLKEDCIEPCDAKTSARVAPLGPEVHAVLSALAIEEQNA